jgi:hypothetical protein
MHLSTWRLARHTSATARGQNHVLVRKQLQVTGRNVRISFNKKEPKGEEL